MGKFDENSGRSVVELSGKSAGGGGGTLFSAAALGRKLIGVLMCGGVYRSCGRGKRGRGSGGGRRTCASRLWEVLESEMSDLELDEMCATEEETRRRTEALAELQGVVRRLHSYEGAGISERDALRKEAAMELRRLAKDDAAARETLAMLGAIPPLVEMLDSDEVGLQVASLYALLNLGIGNNAYIHLAQVLDLFCVLSSSSSAPVADWISSHFQKQIRHRRSGGRAQDGEDNWQGIRPLVRIRGCRRQLLGPQRPRRQQTPHRLLRRCAIPGRDIPRRRSPPCTGKAGRHPSALQPRHCSENVPCLVDAGLVPDLLAAIGDMSVSEKVLPVLSSVVSTVEGRTAVIRTPEAFHILVDVLNWSDSPRCQEEAAYVLMDGMIKAGIVSSLLELTLVGTALAQKRAAGILECLRAEGEEQISEGFPGAPAVAAPLTGTRAEGGPPETTVEEEPGMCEERRAVNQLVQQSMLDTTRRILRRANLPPDLSPSGNLCAPSVHSTVSKSLPF
ncbi:unnamed protein product [Spirodela intermedia]|uniref:Uncharacterized protein n=1 Tax=Spirodela intermedia TaxID=51605 RepID=A0A7I8JJ86_SPIIN|nr:unnamed protein product [Spirodela intermedia]CAA6670237.1 unnamed protein product [Spirodela intermedia]